MDPSAILTFLTGYKPQLETIAGLIVLNLVLGVAAAVKAGQFDWAKLAAFYRTDVIPGLIGWVGLTAAAYFVSPSIAGTDVIGVATANGGFAVVVASLLASIYKSLTDLGVPLPTGAPAAPKA